jgi:threonine dehydrogenase-like Zn-dependent dehydrogenase
MSETMLAAVLHGIKDLRVEERPVPELAAGQVLVRELNYVGSFRYGNVWEEAIRLVAAGRVNLQPLISRVFPLRQAAEALVKDPKFDEWVKQRCPLGRWGTPEDLAWPAVFLAASASDFITGQTLYVDGGWLATF